MASVPTMQQQPTDLGQRLFLTGVFAVMVVELVDIFVNIGSTFEWTAFVLNLFSALFILYLGNWMYSGNKNALAVARGWVGLMAAVAAVGLAFRWLGLMHPDVSGHLGITAIWLGILKLAVYGTFAGWLFSGSVLDFLASQRGETTATAAATTEHPPATGAPVELAADHVTALDGLAGTMKMASVILVAVGLLDMACGLSVVARGGLENFDFTKIGPLLNLVEGLAVVLLGVLLLPPLQNLQGLIGAAQRHMGIVMHLLHQLHTLYLGYIGVFLVLAAVAICRIVFNAF